MWRLRDVSRWKKYRFCDVYLRWQGRGSVEHQEREEESRPRRAKQKDGRAAPLTLGISSG